MASAELVQGFQLSAHDSGSPSLHALTAPCRRCQLRRLRPTHLPSIAYLLAHKSNREGALRVAAPTTWGPFRLPPRLPLPLCRCLPRQSPWSDPSRLLPVPSSATSVAAPPLGGSPVAHSAPRKQHQAATAVTQTAVATPRLGARPPAPQLLAEKSHPCCWLHPSPLSPTDSATSPPHMLTLPWADEFEVPSSWAVAARPRRPLVACTCITPEPSPHD